VDKILLGLIESLIEGARNIFDNAFINLLNKVFYAEEYFMEAVIGSGATFNIARVNEVVLKFAVALIMLKFLKKAFDIYVGWYEGDKDTSPMSLVINFTRAIVTAISFSLLYKIMVDIFSEMGAAILGTLTQAETMEGILDIVLGIINNTLFLGVVGLILIICYCILWIKFLVLGAELFVMRVGFPLACIGLLDGDKGVFAPYLKKIFTICITAIVQVVLVQISLLCAGAGHVIWAITFALAAMKTPRALQDFMFAYGGGNAIGSAINTTYHLSRLTRVLRR